MSEEIKQRRRNSRWLKHTKLLLQNSNPLILNLIDIVANEAVWIMWQCLWTHTTTKPMDMLLEKEKQWHYTSLTPAFGRSSSQTHTHCAPDESICHFLKSPLILPLIVATKGSWFPFCSPFGCSTLKWICSSIYCHFLGSNCRLIIIQYWQELEDELIQFRRPNIVSGILSNPGGIFMKCHTVLKASLLSFQILHIGPLNLSDEPIIIIFLLNRISKHKKRKKYYPSDYSQLSSSCLFKL